MLSQASPLLYLSSLFSNDACHRTVNGRPENILCDSRGAKDGETITHIKLCDFNLSRTTRTAGPGRKYAVLADEHAGELFNSPLAEASPKGVKEKGPIPLSFQVAKRP